MVLQTKNIIMSWTSHRTVDARASVPARAHVSAHADASVAVNASARRRIATASDTLHVWAPTTHLN